MSLVSPSFAARMLVVTTLFISPSSAQTIAQAQQMQASGEWHAAEQAWRSLAAASPKDYRLWASLGATLAHQERYPEAIGAYQKALALQPHDPQTNLNVGLAYFKTGRLAEAVAPLQQAAKALPANSQAQLLLGMSLFGVGKYVEAAPHIEQASDEEKSKLPLQQVLAQCYLYAKEYPKATAAFERILRQDPDSPAVHMFLGEAYDADGRIDQAIEEFRIAETKGAIPNEHFGLGYLYWKSHDYPAAEAEFRQELSVDPRHYQALAYLGDALIKQNGLSEEAEQLLRKSIAIQDGVWLTHFHLGVIASDQKRYADAAKELKAAIALSPDRAEPHYRLAQVFKATGKQAEAQAELAEVKKLHQKNQDDLVDKISGPGSSVQ